MNNKYFGVIYLTLIKKVNVNQPVAIKLSDRLQLSRSVMIIYFLNLNRYLYLTPNKRRKQESQTSLFTIFVFV